MTIQSGLATLYARARRGSAVSLEADAVQQAATTAVSALERSQALFGSKSEAISKLWLLANECATEGWDGSSASAIDPQAIYSAVEFIRVLPTRFPLPEFAAEPDGSVSLDWIRSRNRMLSVSVGAGDRLAFAWLDGTDRGHGVARFAEGAIPTRIIDAIAAITDPVDAAVRAA